MRGEAWWANTGVGGDRPVIVLTRDPLADRLSSVVVVACTRTIRGLTSEVLLDASDGFPQPCVANFDNVLTLPRNAFRRLICQLGPATADRLCVALNRALSC